MQPTNASPDPQEHPVQSISSHGERTSLPGPSVTTSLRRLVIRPSSLEEVQVERDELEQQGEELTGELWRQEGNACRYCELHQAAAAEVADLKNQLAAIADERAMAQKKRDHDIAMRASKCLAGFASLASMFQDDELDNENVIAVRALVARNENPVQTALAVRDFLFALQQAWGREMRKIPGEIDAIYKPWLATIDARIAELKRYPDVLAKLAQSDAETWKVACRDRHRFVNDIKELFRLGDFANEAVAASCLILIGKLPADLEYETIKNGYRFIMHVREGQYDLDQTDVDSDLSRSFDAVQQTIREMVESGHRVRPLAHDALSAAVDPEWAIVIPGTRDDVNWSPDDDTRIDSSRFQGRADSSDDFFEQDHFAFNPANGQLMLGGTGGVDCYGNAYGFDFNDPGHW